MPHTHPWYPTQDCFLLRNLLYDEKTAISGWPQDSLVLCNTLPTEASSVEDSVIDVMYNTAGSAGLKKSFYALN